MTLTQVTIPTTDTVSKDIPDPARDDIPLPSNPQTVLLLGLFLFAVFASAYVAAEVVLPIVMAFVLKMLLQPGMRLLARIRIPRSLAALILILAVFAVFVGIGAAVSGPARTWAEKLPEGIPRLQERLKFLARPIQALQTFLHSADGAGGKGAGLGLTDMLLKGTRHFASGIFETILILFFLLVSGDTFLRRLVEILPRFKDKRQVVDLSQQVESNVSAYLVTITLMNLAVGLATAAAMWACGLGDPILWGVVAFLLNYVPIMGPLIGVVVFLFAGLLEIEGFGQALLPAGIYFLIHVVEGEAITPMLLARRFTLNPVLVMISLTFWFWMWGIPGAILAVPLLAITKIVCDGIKPLNAIGHFLEGDT